MEEKCEVPRRGSKVKHVKMLLSNYALFCFQVNALIELEHGRAMKVYVEKADGGFWCVVVPREATVHDLKKALKNHVALMLVGIV